MEKLKSEYPKLMEALYNVLWPQMADPEESKVPSTEGTI